MGRFELTGSESPSPMPERMALAIDLRTPRVASCFCRSDLALAGAFLSLVISMEINVENIEFHIPEQFNHNQSCCVSDSAVCILQASDQRRDVLAEQQAVVFCHLQGFVLATYIKLVQQKNARLKARACSSLWLGGFCPSMRFPAHDIQPRCSPQTRAQ